MISRIGKSNIVQRFIKKTEDKKFYESLNHKLPLIESAFTTVSYVAVTQLSKKIPEDRKPALTWQALIGGAAGIAISKKLDDFTKKHNDKLCQELEKLNLPKAKNTIRGARILLPIAITTLILRYLVSVSSVPLSTFIAKIQHKLSKKQTKNS